jgi:hypothetical protein
MTHKTFQSHESVDSGVDADYLEKMPSRERSGNRPIDIKSGYAYSLTQAENPTTRARSGGRPVDVDSGYAEFLAPEFEKSAKNFKDTLQTMKNRVQPTENKENAHRPR